jgi:small-conductance mechanosensitive channel
MDHAALAFMALAGAALVHALLRRLERRAPVWLARRRASSPGAAALALERYRAPIGLALLVPKAALWIAAAGFATSQVMALAAARDVAFELVGASLRAPLVQMGERSWSALDLVQLPALLAALWLAVSLLARGVRRQLVRAGAETATSDLLSGLLRYSIAGLACLVLLQVWGLDLSSLALLGGVVGVGIGFGLQNIASNFVSGLLLSVERPIKAGDFVTVGAFEGSVLRIGARSTEILTRDHVSILVPNSRFLEQEVVNWSHRDPMCKVHVPVGVAYGSDPERVRAALLEAARGHPLVLHDPRPTVDLEGFGDNALLFDLEVWTQQPAERKRILSDLNYRVEAVLRRHGLSVPFPQRDLHLRSPEIARVLEAWARRALPEGEDAAPAEPAPEPEVVPAALPALPGAADWSEDALRELAARLRGPGGVPIRDRRHLLGLHRRCFVGSEAVTWLVENEDLTRDEAVRAGRRLVEAGLVRHVLDEHGFEDAWLFYRFAADA